MKRSILLCVALMAMLPTMAQSTLTAQARVAEIRKLYAGAKERIAWRKEAELPPDEMVINNSYMAAGAGPIKEVYHYYYSGDYSEEARSEVYQVHFITHSHNVGALEYYEEILYDEDGVLAFYYEHAPGGEYRYYFDKGTLIHQIGTDGDPRKEYDGELLMLQRYCGELSNAFSLLMNRNYD